MNQKDEFSKWISTIETALSNKKTTNLEESIPVSKCGCGNWECKSCFPDAYHQDDACDSREPPSGQQAVLKIYPERNSVADFEESGSCGGMGAGGMAQVEEEEFSDECNGQQSPLTYGDELEEDEFYGDSDGQQSPLTYGDDLEEEIDSEQLDQADLIDQIMYLQDLGISKDTEFHSREELENNYSPEELSVLFAQAKGEVSEESKPTKTKDRHYLDDLDDNDILNPRQAHLPAEYEPEDTADIEPENRPAQLPTASRATTQNKLRNMTPSDTMRDYMSRIDPTAGNDEPELPDTPANELVIRTARDVPAVVSSAMQAAGTQSPDWHTVDNLPGYQQRNTRGMGRQIFSMFTTTPLENIKTIANVGGQGPNTNEEIRAVAAFLRDNAEDLGEVDVSHGMAIPGYKPDVKEYRANGIRFQVVRDPMGQYIYAYPDADARLQGNQDQTQNRLGRDRDMSRLTESAKAGIPKPTLFEQIAWDEEINKILKKTRITESECKTAELDESTLSKVIGSQKGGQRLVKWLHSKHKLSNEAELVPAPFTERLFWTQFKRNPDDFVIVSSQDGVAGIKPSEEYIKHMQEKYAKKGKAYNPGSDPNLRYQIMAFTDEGEKIDPSLLQQQPDADKEERGDFATQDPTVIKARMGTHTGRDVQNPDNVFNLLAEQIGPIVTVYITGFENVKGGEEPKGSVEREKMAKRAELAKVDKIPEKDAILQIFKKVRPVLKTLSNQALSQIQRTMQRYMQGSNFEGAQKLAGSANKLKQFLINLDTSGEINIDDAWGSPTREFSKAIISSIESASGSQRGSSAFQQWLNDAAKGNSVALKPVLDALREKLVALS